MKAGILRFEKKNEPNVTSNPLLAESKVNEICEGELYLVKDSLTQVRMPMIQVWKGLVEVNMIPIRSRLEAKHRIFCEFHGDFEVYNI